MYNLDTGHEFFTCPTALTSGFGYRTSKVYNVFLLFLPIRYDMQDMLVNVLRILKPRKTCNLSKHSNPCCVSCWGLKFIMDNSYWLRSKSSLQGGIIDLSKKYWWGKNRNNGESNTWNQLFIWHEIACVFFPINDIFFWYIYIFRFHHWLLYQVFWLYLLAFEYGQSTKHMKL